MTAMLSLNYTQGAYNRAVETFIKL